MRKLFLSILSLLFLSAIALAGAGGDGGSTVQGRASQSVNASVTQSVVQQLGEARSLCQSLPSEYRADCVAQEFKDAAKAAKGSAYRKARTELNGAARKLDRLVRQNSDSSAAPIRRNGKTYKAVKKEAVAEVSRAAVKVIAETETKLLRSSGSGERKTHYVRIAKAVGSTKVIFRS